MSSISNYIPNSRSLYYFANQQFFSQYRKAMFPSLSYVTTLALIFNNLFCYDWRSHHGLHGHKLMGIIHVNQVGFQIRSILHVTVSLIILIGQGFGSDACVRFEKIGQFAFEQWLRENAIDCFCSQ